MWRINRVLLAKIRDETESNIAFSNRSTTKISEFYKIMRTIKRKRDLELVMLCFLSQLLKRRWKKRFTRSPKVANINMGPKVDACQDD